MTAKKSLTKNTAAGLSYCRPFGPEAAAAGSRRYELSHWLFALVLPPLTWEARYMGGSWCALSLAR